MNKFMKNNLKIIVSLTLACSVFILLVTPIVKAQDIVVALSPYQKDALANIKQVLKHLTTLESGSKATLLDGYGFKKIGEFKIPTGNISPKAMLKRNAGSVAALMRFAKANSLQTGASVSNAIRLPQLLRHIAENYSRGGKSGFDVVVLGSPFYDDPLERSVSMAGGYLPSDGHINASRAVSPYGTADSANLFSNIRVHMGFGDVGLQSDQHRFFIRRFWTLFIETQGGKLVSFISDKATLFERVSNKVKSLPHNFKLEPSTKLEMIRLRRNKPSNPIYQREISNKALDLRAIQNAKDVEIGISWDCRTCDLDLYAMGKPHAEILYFGRDKTAMGNHWKDFTSSPNLFNGYETISFHVPLNLQQLAIVVNFYEGSAPEGVHGKLRISVEGQTFEQAFTITATSGNKSANMDKAFQSGKAKDTHSLMFDPLKIVSLFKGSKS